MMFRRFFYSFCQVRVLREQLRNTVDWQERSKLLSSLIQQQPENSMQRAFDRVELSQVYRRNGDITQFETLAKDLVHLDVDQLKYNNNDRIYQESLLNCGLNNIRFQYYKGDNTLLMREWCDLHFKSLHQIHKHELEHQQPTPELRQQHALSLAEAHECRSSIAVLEKKDSEVTSELDKAIQLVKNFKTKEALDYQLLLVQKLADHLSKLEQYDAAAKYYDQALEIVKNLYGEDSQDYFIQYETLTYNYLRTQPNKALQLAEDLYAKNKSFLIAQFYFSILTNTGNLQKAEELYNLIEKEGTQEISYHLTATSFFTQKNDYAKIEEHIRRLFPVVQQTENAFQKALVVLEMANVANRVFQTLEGKTSLLYDLLPLLDIQFPFAAGATKVIVFQVDSQVAMINLLKSIQEGKAPNLDDYIKKYENDHEFSLAMVEKVYNGCEMLAMSNFKPDSVRLLGQVIEKLKRQKFEGNQENIDFLEKKKQEFSQ